MRTGRFIGLVWLLYFITAIIGQFLLQGIVVPGNATATAANLLAQETVFRVGIAVGLIANAFYVALAVLLYEMFRRVDRTAALLAAFFSLSGCVIQSFGSVFPLTALSVVDPNQPLGALHMGQSPALALMLFNAQMHAINIGLVFFGFNCLLLGYLILKSKFVPPILGMLLVLAGAGWLTFLFAPLPTLLAVVVQVLGFIAELAVLVWLLVRGGRIEIGSRA